MDDLTEFQNEESELALLDPQDFPIESGESVLTILEDFGDHLYSLTGGEEHHDEHDEHADDSEESAVVMFKKPRYQSQRRRVQPRMLSAETEEEDGIFGAYYLYKYDLDSDDKAVSIAIYGDMKASASIPSYGAVMLQTIAQQATGVSDLQINLNCN